jgi:hypothetical protein
MTDQKFCVNCMHYRFSEPFGRFGGPVFLECLHPKAPRDHVTGAFPDAASQRLDESQCGPDGARYLQRTALTPAPTPRRWWWPW